MVSAGAGCLMVLAFVLGAEVRGFDSPVFKLSSVKQCVLFSMQTLPPILWRRHKPCEFLGFVWTDCRGTN